MGPPPVGGAVRRRRGGPLFFTDLALIRRLSLDYQQSWFCSRPIYRCGCTPMLHTVLRCPSHILSPVRSSSIYTYAYSPGPRCARGGTAYLFCLLVSYFTYSTTAILHFLAFPGFVNPKFMHARPREPQLGTPPVGVAICRQAGPSPGDNR